MHNLNLYIFPILANIVFGSSRLKKSHFQVKRNRNGSFQLGSSKREIRIGFISIRSHSMPPYVNIDILYIKLSKRIYLISINQWAMGSMITVKLKSRITFLHRSPSGYFFED